MAIIQPKIEVPEEIFEDYLNGDIEIKGLALDNDSRQIVKHLDLADDTNDDNSDENSDIVSVDESNSNSDNIAIFAALITAVTAAAVGTYFFIKNRKKKKVEEFKNCFLEYITCISNQNLTVDVIDNLITAIDKLKKSMRKKISIDLTKGELSQFAEFLCIHTHNLEISNNVNVQDNDHSDEEQNDFILNLRDNLVRQKAVFEQAA